MTFTHDRDADAKHLRRVEGTHGARVGRVTDDIALGFGARKPAFGIDAPGTSRSLEHPNAPAIDVGALLPRLVSS